VTGGREVGHRLGSAPPGCVAAGEAPRRGPVPSRDARGRSDETRGGVPLRPRPDAVVEELRELRVKVATLENLLTVAEEQLKQLGETSLDVICHFRPDGVISYVSRACNDVLGFTSGEMVGTHYRDYFDQDQSASGEAIFEQAVLGERIELLELTARHRDGHPVPLEMCAIPLFRDGRVIGIHGIARDISKRRRAQEGLRHYSHRLEHVIQEHESELVAMTESFALRLSRSQAGGRVLREREELLRASFEQAGIGLALVSPDGRFLRVNDRLAELLGVERDELLDRRWQDLTHVDDLERELASWRSLCGSEIARSSGDRRWVLGDGSERWTRVVVSAIRTRGGPPNHLVMAVAPSD
jgi:two-component system, NarL family, sensor histidine kinase UhpB